jgi:hypothetical protein
VVEEMSKTRFGFLERGDVFNGDHHAFPIFPAFRQDAPMQANVERFALQGVINSFAAKTDSTAP